MSTCEKCEEDVPMGSIQEYFSWNMKQRHKMSRDEMLYGSSFSCVGCGRRFDPLDTTVEFDEN